VKTDSLSKTQLVLRTKCSFCCHLRETYVKTKKATKLGVFISGIVYPIRNSVKFSFYVSVVAGNRGWLDYEPLFYSNDSKANE